ncbi:hypothetical protein D3C73_1268430 [compost metagenome]
MAKTSRTNNIIRTTGMPRRNSSTTCVGIRIQGIKEIRSRQSAMPKGNAITAATAAAASVARMPWPIRLQTSGAMGP